MPGRPTHDWADLLKRTAALIKAGTKPQWKVLGAELGVPQNTLRQSFERFGITRDMLRKPDSWPRVQFEEERPAEFAGIKVADILAHLKKRPMTIEELSNTLDRGVDSVLQAVNAMSDVGYNVVRENQVVKVPAYKAPLRAPVLSDAKSRHMKFGVASDWHVGSKAAQISALIAFIELAVKKHECEHILVPGDICAGFGVYRGQQNEVYAVGASDQLDALVNTIPQYNGVKFYVMGGNHDYSFIKSNGYNIVDASCMLRDDWVYMGFDEAVVPLTPDLDIVMWHPSGGVPYALTYRGQKFAAELAQRELIEIITGKKERPRTRFIYWGHLHVAASFPHGPIQVTGPGCFEGRNSYLKQKGLTPMIRGVVEEVWLTEDNLIQHHVAHEYAYVEQDEDWRRAYNPVMARRPTERIVPMFSLKGTKK